MNISWKQLNFFIIWLVILIVIWNLIWWNLWLLVFCVTLFLFIVFVFYKEWSYHKDSEEFDDLLITSWNIDYKLSELINDKKYWKYVKEYEANKKYVVEKNNELSIYSKSKNDLLLKVTVNTINYKAFSKYNEIDLHNLISIDDDFISYWKESIYWFIFYLKEEIFYDNEFYSEIISWKEKFLPWTNWSNLPIRRKMLLFRIKKFFEKNSINVEVNY